jgi:polyisoprenoid-binding protein YceI
MRKLTLAVAASLALATALTAPAQAVDTYAIDKSHSEVSFQVRHLVTNTRGQFDDYTGTIKMDAANPANSSVEFTIQATSINTFNENRDKHLRSPDFFEVEKHPTIAFKSSKVTKTGDNKYDVTGTFTMRGVSKELTLPVTFLGQVKDPWGNTKAGFETATTLNRKDYGIVWNAALDQGGFVLGDEVKVAINLEVNLQK